LLQSFISSAQESAITLISDIEHKKSAFEEKGWNISFPGGSGRKSVTFNIRPIVYKIMEAALEFKDIIDNVLAFDATKYGLKLDISITIVE
jgi:hypothetical protein